MRTINETHRDRLVAEADEAEIVGLTKVAENLTRQIEKNAVRANDSNYIYSSQDFENDVAEGLWDLIVRASDFHDAHVDSEKAQKLVETYAGRFISDIRKIAGSDSGAYEPTLPGENAKEILNIEEE